MLYYPGAMNFPIRNLLVGLGATASAVLLFAATPACGSDDNSEFPDPNAADGAPFEGGFNPNGKPDGGDPFAKDPLPKYCVIDGGPAGPAVTGTVECPSDKNKPGCGCDVVGMQAACWTGLRVNRRNGACKDGMTTCKQVNENAKAWGPCEGEVLPTAGQTKGAAACKCFSLGQWKLANLSPCFIEYNGDKSMPYPVSTVTDGSGSNSLPVGQSDCPKIPQATPAPPPLPASGWTTDTLKVDCAGHFKVCYQIRAGDIKNPTAGDCPIMDKICVEADYLQENVEQAFPPLGAWTTTPASSAAYVACAAKFRATGGYGEMTVLGQSVLCDEVDDGSGGAFVFNRVQYCPTKCEGGMNPTDPECVNCKQDGSGEFK